MHKINYELIGTLPKLNVFSPILPRLIAEFQAGKADAMRSRIELTEAFKTGGPKAVAMICDKHSKDPAVTERIALGVTIELCAQHFYGIDTVSMNSIDETIAEMLAVDSTLEFGK